MFSIFKGFAKRAENKFGFKIKKIRSDIGSEFENSIIEYYCDEKGIKQDISAKYTPQQNRVIERKNQTLIDMARSSFWNIIFLTVFDRSNQHCLSCFKWIILSLIVKENSI
jgi:transposase InsO family protein